MVGTAGAGYLKINNSSGSGGSGNVNYACHKVSTGQALSAGVASNGSVCAGNEMALSVAGDCSAAGGNLVGVGFNGSQGVTVKCSVGAGSATLEAMCCKF